MEIKSGVVYRPDSEKRNPIKISVMVAVLRTVSGLLSWSGLGLILVSIGGLVLVYIPLGVAEIRYGFSKTQLAAMVREVQKRDYQSREQEEKRNEEFLGKPDGNEIAEWAVPDENYSIHIPKIFATAEVIENVNADDSEEYLAALKQGVAEAAGLAHPGQKGTTFLFAHSVGSRVDFARYNAVFYLLDKLEIGDKVEIMYQGKLFKYQVSGREILSATDVKYLVPQAGEEKLVLQTCYPPGTTWKRLVISAKRL